MNTSAPPQLQNKRILLVSAWISMKLDIFQHIHNLGVKIVVLDKPNPAIEYYVESGLFEGYIKADIDDDNNFDAIMRAIYESGFTFDGVTTLFEFYTPLTARIATELDLPGHALSAINTIRNKYETRKACEACGLPSPRFALINSQSELAEKAAYVGFPCVLKPNKGTGSTDVFTIHNHTELEERYRYLIESLKTSYTQSTEKSLTHVVWHSGFQMILEEYLDGDEFGVDCTLYDGQIVFSSITSQKPQSHMIETGDHLPARYAPSKQDELIDFTRQVLSCIGFFDGVFHLEFKYTSNGPCLIDVNARTGGDPIYKMVKRVWNVDLIEQQLMICMGMNIPQQKASIPVTNLASHMVLGEDMRNRCVLLVMGSYIGKKVFYERARELGVKLVVLDGPGHWTKDYVQEGLFEAFIEVELTPQETLFERSLEAIKATGLTFDGVATFEEFASILTAQLAMALNLPGLPPEAVQTARNKYRTREVCTAKGIPGPLFYCIERADQLDLAAKFVGFPAVLKPISGASSSNAFRVENAQDLHRRYHETIDSLRLKTSGVTSDDEAELIWLSTHSMILEEYLDGEEYDVDCLLSNGKFTYMELVHDWHQPSLKEVNSSAPPSAPAHHQHEIKEMTKRVLTALGFRDGVFHVEAKYTSKGPRLVEVNARLGGGTRWQIHKHVWNVDLVEEYLRLILGLPVEPQQAASPLCYIAETFLRTPVSGVVQNIGFVHHAWSHPAILHAYASVHPGQKVIGGENGSGDCLGVLLVHGATPEEAEQNRISIIEWTSLEGVVAQLPHELLQ